MILCDLVHSLGGPVPNYKKLVGDADNWENNLGLGQCLPKSQMRNRHSPRVKVIV